MNLSTFIEEKINHYAEMIAGRKSKADELALGELYFYTALRRVLNDKGSTQDLGMMDAINDTLQHMGLLDSDMVFYK